MWLCKRSGWVIMQVIRSALLDGNLAPADVAGLQLHGTGTALGDPIEMGAACAVLNDAASGDQLH